MNVNNPESGNAELVLPFHNIDRAALPVAGGKAANLGEMIRESELRRQQAIDAMREFWSRPT